MTKQVWEPLEDGLIEQGDGVLFRVMKGGRQLRQVDTHMGSDNSVFPPENTRLCQLVEADDAPGVTLTPDVREAMIEVAKEALLQYPAWVKYLLSADQENALRAWLAQQGGGDAS